MYAPACDDERTTFVSYIGEQLDAIRASAIGLTEEQARMRPCRSALSIGGLIKHATYVMRGTTDRLTGRADPNRALDEAAFAAHESSFTLTDDETAAGAIFEFDAVRIEYVAAIAATDPSAPTLQPPAPWFGILDSANLVRPLHPGAPDRGARPPRRARRHPARADRRHGRPGDRAERGGRTRQRLLPALRRCAGHHRRPVAPLRPVSWSTQITGLIGFDIGAGFRTCDPSCSDSLNGAPTTTANQQFALAA